MTLHFIGLGLDSKKDITVLGLERVKQSSHVYLEHYTAVLHESVEDLEAFYGKKIIVANRELVERRAYEILEDAKTKDVAFLVVGDIFGATTHTDLLLRAREKKIPCTFTHNASIMNAIGIVGLELYKYGKTTSIPFPSEGFEPETPYDVIKMNQEHGLHTLVLLDLRPEIPKFMTVNEGLNYLMKIEQKRGEGILSPDLKVIGCARIGQNTGEFTIKYGPLKELVQEDFGTPMHCIIVPGKLHFIEEEALEMWK